MSQISESSIESIQQWTLLQAELLHRSNQLHHFARIRERRAHSGGAPESAYRKLVERHDALAVMLRHPSTYTA
jgi:hypothetical protein